MTSRLVVALLALQAGTASEKAPTGDWTGFGGPDGDFRVSTEPLSESWSSEGPTVRWRREIADGYSALLYRDGRLYTMTGSGGKESLVCLSAIDGSTIWEHRWQPPLYTALPGYGSAPRATPLLVNDRLFGVGATGSLRAVRATDGSLLWQQELGSTGLGAEFPGHGYASSPVLWGDTIILPGGGESKALLAFDQATGNLRWQKQDFGNSYSSPRVVTIAGKPQLLAFLAHELVALDPDDGALLWRFEHENQWRHNITPPIVFPDDTIFLSSPQAGARGLHIVEGEAGLEAEELWRNRRVQFHHGTAVAEGDWVYGSSGFSGPSFLMAVHRETGEIAWRDRHFSKANVLIVGERLLVLDEDGELALLEANPERMQVLAQSRITRGVSWTAPTVVGSTLYVRNRQELLALDLRRTPN